MNIRGLAYVVAKTTDTAKWKAYAENVLGMMALPGPADGLRIKMDERQFRIAVEKGGRDAYTASGWEVGSAQDFDAAVKTLQAHGVTHELGDAALCEARCVQALLAFQDPSGNRHEVVWGFKSDFTRFNSPMGVPRFITGDIGMGHTVLPAPNFEATRAFASEVMGFGLSDIFNFKPAGDGGPVVPIHFLHCANARHHSLALAAFPVEAGCVHIMVEVDDVPEVGRALDRMREHQVLQTATLGQHTNDRMISFYMRTPSGFDVEVGCGGAVIDWNAHIAHEFTKVSLWGHDFSVGNATRA